MSATYAQGLGCGVVRRVARECSSGCGRAERRIGRSRSGLCGCAWTQIVQCGPGRPELGVVMARRATAGTPWRCPVRAAFRRPPNPLRSQASARERPQKALRRDRGAAALGVELVEVGRHRREQALILT